MKLKVLDLFSGIGGFSLRLTSTGGFETTKFVEFEPFCQKILSKNFPNIPIEGDIRNVKGQEFEADIIVGGFPCQPFSVAENKKEQTITVTSGQKCFDSLKKSNQSSLLVRMCKELLTSKTAWYSDRCSMTWKVRVSKSNVSLFQLRASVHGTNDIEHGLLATPNTMDYLPPRSAEGKKLMEGHRKGRKRPSNLREQVDPETMKMYPTPRANEPGRTTKGYGRGLAELMEGKEQIEPKRKRRICIQHHRQAA